MSVITASLQMAYPGGFQTVPDEALRGTQSPFGGAAGADRQGNVGPSAFSQPLERAILRYLLHTRGFFFFFKKGSHRSLKKKNFFFFDTRCLLIEKIKAGPEERRKLAKATEWNVTVS